MKASAAMDAADGRPSRGPVDPSRPLPADPGEPLPVPKGVLRQLFPELPDLAELYPDGPESGLK